MSSLFIGEVWQRMFGVGRWIGLWVEFYSTPFVFLRDTFTGEFLGGRDVGRGHFLRKCKGKSGNQCSFSRYLVFAVIATKKYFI